MCIEWFYKVYKQYIFAMCATPHTKIVLIMYKYWFHFLDGLVKIVAFKTKMTELPLIAPT